MVKQSSFGPLEEEPGGSVKNGIGMEEDAHLLERNAKRSDGPPPIIPFKVILPITSQGSPTS